VITIGDTENPITVDKIMQRGRRLTCSYEEEACAMELATEWINEHCAPHTNILICTDSKLLCQKLSGTSIHAADLRQKLLRSPGNITIQWVPGHSDIPGNELADTAAKEATMIQSLPRPHLIQRHLHSHRRRNHRTTFRTPTPKPSLCWKNTKTREPTHHTSRPSPTSTNTLRQAQSIQEIQACPRRIFRPWIPSM